MAGANKLFGGAPVMATHLQVGDAAPDFELATDSGAIFRLSEHRGHPVILYFYPEDDTEGCTVEAIEFSAVVADFAAIPATVIGVSPDPVEKHCKFRDKHDLTVTLAADPDLVVSRAYGVWGEKKTFGHAHIGIHRTSFLIAPDGTIAGIYPVRRIKGHAVAMLEAARTLARTFS